MKLFVIIVLVIGVIGITVYCAIRAGLKDFENDGSQDKGDIQR